MPKATDMGQVQNMFCEKRFSGFSFISIAQSQMFESQGWYQNHNS